MSTTQPVGVAEHRKTKKSKLKSEDASHKRRHTDDQDEAQPKKSKKIKREADAADVDTALTVDDQHNSDLVTKKDKKKKKKAKSVAVGTEQDEPPRSTGEVRADGESADAAETLLDVPVVSEVGPSGLKEHKPSRRESADWEREAQSIEDAQAIKKLKKKKKRQLADTQAESSVNGIVLQDTDMVNSAGPSDGTHEKHTPFVQHTASFYLTLSPCAYNFPLEGVCAEHLSPLLLTYYPPLHGVVLNYSNARLSEVLDETVEPGVSHVLSKSINEYAVSFVWLTADFTIFRPRRGTYLEGYVNLQNESLLGLVCYNFFNASIERARLPEDWRWIGDGDGMSDSGKDKAGYFVDGHGKKVEGKLTFKAKDFDATPSTENGGGTINIVGTLLSPAQDKALDV